MHLKSQRRWHGSMHPLDGGRWSVSVHPIILDIPCHILPNQQPSAIQAPCVIRKLSLDAYSQSYLSFESILCHRSLHYGSTVAASAGISLGSLID